MVVCALLVTSCAHVPLPALATPADPIRFLLTFDDGPSPAAQNNPTAQIIDMLATNSIQPGIKSIFFVQTRWSRAGGSTIGPGLMQRVAAEGHILAVHSGSDRGHINHRAFDSEALAATLVDARNDILAISGQSTTLVRPPYWSFDARTLSVYNRVHMSMLLTDLRANDGASWIFQIDRETGGRMVQDLKHMRRRLAMGSIPTVGGVIPVVVTFHDTNSHTAEHLAAYLAMLVRLAHEQALPLADPPFYTDTVQALQAANARSNNRAIRADLAP